MTTLPFTARVCKSGRGYVLWIPKAISSGLKLENKSLVVVQISKVPFSFSPEETRRSKAPYAFVKDEERTRIPKKEKELQMQSKSPNGKLKTK